jgi:hypothetical protein
MQSWDWDTWDEYDSAIDIAFHTRPVFFSPLMNYVAMPNGADTYYTGNELLRGHTNYNVIGNRARFIDAMYVDGRKKKLEADKRYGGKAQIWEFDELVSRFGKGTPQFMLNVLRTRLMGGVIETHEMLARNAMLDYAIHKFLADGSKWVATSNDFDTISTASSWKVDLKLLEQARLRMAERSLDYRQEWGTYAQPVPGFPGDILVITSPGVMYDIWNTAEGQWMQDLRELQDQRIINGGVVRWKGVTFVETMWSVLFNAGSITRQVAVTEPIKFGDGAPDPDDTRVDNVYLTGQSTSNQTHYVQCSDLGTSQFAAGNRVTIHIERTSDWGVTNGLDFTDGMSYEAEIYSVDETNERLTFRQPIPLEYAKAFQAAPQGGSATTCYAFVTKAQHIHPIYIVGSRGMATFASRRKIRVYNPIDTADLPNVLRVTWDEYGEMNRWNLDLYEVHFVAASSGLSGRGTVQVR